jgi:hypothetical protein
MLSNYFRDCFPGHWGQYGPRCAALIAGKCCVAASYGVTFSQLLTNSLKEKIIANAALQQIASAEIGVADPRQRDIAPIDRAHYN